MKLKYIIALVACIALSTTVIDAKGKGTCGGKATKECAKDCDQVCGEACTCDQKKQDCTKEGAKDCDKKQQQKKAGKGSCGA